MCLKYYYLQREEFIKIILIYYDDRHYLMFDCYGKNRL